MAAAKKPTTPVTITKQSIVTRAVSVVALADAAAVLAWAYGRPPSSQPDYAKRLKAGEEFAADGHIYKRQGGLS